MGNSIGIKVNAWYPFIANSGGTNKANIVVDENHNIGDLKPIFYGVDLQFTRFKKRNFGWGLEYGIQFSKSASYFNESYAPLNGNYDYSVRTTRRYEPFTLMRNEVRISAMLRSDPGKKGFYHCSQFGVGLGITHIMKKDYVYDDHIVISYKYDSQVIPSSDSSSYSIVYFLDAHGRESDLSVPYALKLWSIAPYYSTEFGFALSNRLSFFGAIKHTLNFSMIMSGQVRWDAIFVEYLKQRILLEATLFSLGARFNFQ